jgi:hypothetical protein
MANLVITSNEQTVTIVTNVFKPFIGFDILTVDKDYLYNGLSSSTTPTFIEIFQYDSDQKHQVTWDQTSTTTPIVDSVNGVAPTSEAHLYEMLTELNDFTPLAYDSAALEASHVVSATDAQLFNVSGYNSKSSDQFIQIHNASALPADGAVAIVSFKVKAGDNFYWNSGAYAKDFPVGIVVCNSSTAPVKTIGGADCLFNVQYKTS